MMTTVWYLLPNCDAIGNISVTGTTKIYI